MKKRTVAAVRESASAMRYAPASLCDDRELLLTAIRQDASALQYASQRLKADKELVLVAVRKDGALLIHAAPRLREDPTILASIKGNWEAVRHLSADKRGHAEDNTWDAMNKTGLQDAFAEYQAKLFKGSTLPQWSF